MMVQSQNRFLCTVVGLSILSTGGIPSGAPTVLPARQEEPKLKVPFRVKLEEMAAGNPLAQYAELVKMEKDYEADAAMRSTYWQARGTVASYLGDTLEADRNWNMAFPNRSSASVLLETPLSRMRPESAIDVIVRAADKHN